MKKISKRGKMSAVYNLAGEAEQAVWPMNMKEMFAIIRKVVGPRRSVEQFVKDMGDRQRKKNKAALWMVRTLWRPAELPCSCLTITRLAPYFLKSKASGENENDDDIFEC